MSDRDEKRIEQKALEYIVEYGLGPHFMACPLSGDLTREQCEMLDEMGFDPYRDTKHARLRAYVRDMSRLAEQPEGMRNVE